MYTLGKKIVLKPIKNNETTKGGIVIPEYSTSVVSGKVRCFGTNSVKIKIDDTVLYEKMGAREVEVNGEMLHVIQEEDVLVIL